MSDNAPPASKPGRELVLLGRFGAPHGVRGEIRLQSFTADPLAIASYGPLFDKSGARSFVLAHVRPQGKDMLVARVEGVTDRAGAERLARIELYAPRAKLPEPDEDEFYLADLEGLRAETVEGATLGHVLAVRNFGAGDILEVRPPAGRRDPDVPLHQGGGSDRGHRRRTRGDRAAGGDRGRRIEARRPSGEPSPMP